MYKYIDTINTYTQQLITINKIKKIAMKSKVERARLFNPEDGIRNRVP